MIFKRVKMYIITKYIIFTALNVSFTADATGKLHVFGIDSHTSGVYST